MSSRNLKTLDDRSLLECIASKDELAFAEIYNRYKSKVYSYAFKILKFEDRAEDIVHEVFLNIWHHPGLSEIENLSYYLRRVTANQTLKLLRRHQLEITANKRIFADWQEGHNETEQEIILHDTHAQLHKAIESLPPQQKKVYLLCKEEGLEYKEVAEQLSISRLTVKTHMQHALRFLRSYLSSRTDVTIFFFLILIFI